MAESMHRLDLVRLQITIVRHQIHGVVRQECRALTNQPSVQLVPVRSRWGFPSVYHCNFVVMSIGCSCLLMGVSKSPVLFNRDIQPVLSRNALVLFQCVKQIKKTDCRVLCVPRFHSLFPGKQRHLTVQFLCSWFGCNGYKGGEKGGVENPDTSLVRRLKHYCQYRNTKSRKRRNPQTKTKETEATRANPNAGGEESVEKPDTSLARQFKHLTRKQEETKTPRVRNQPNGTNEAALKAVMELSAIRGGRSGKRKAGSPDSL